MSIRILLVDDHRILREGLRSLLAQQADMKVVGEAGDGRRAIDLTRQLRPDAVVMDIVMPLMDGIEATRRICGESPHAKVIALSMHSDRHYVSEMLRAGASGYVVKDCAFQELIEALRTVASGRPYLSAAITGHLVEEFVRQNGTHERPAASPLVVLTSREIQVLHLLADGKRVREIAGLLDISVKTVESHRQNIMDKLEIHSTVELTRFAWRQGLSVV